MESGAFTIVEEANLTRDTTKNNVRQQEKTPKDLFCIIPISTVLIFITPYTITFIIKNIESKNELV